MAAEVWMRPLASVTGNTLHAVHAALELEALVNILPCDEKGHFLETARLRFARAHAFHAPALAPRRSGYTCAERSPREKRGFIAPGARADFHDGVGANRLDRAAP